MVLGLEAQRKIKCWDAWSKKNVFFWFQPTTGMVLLCPRFFQTDIWFIEAVDINAMPPVKLLTDTPHVPKKSSTDEQSALNINRKKGKKTKQWQSHILAKDVNVTDWMELMIVFLPDKPARVIIRLFLESILIQSNSKNIV